MRDPPFREAAVALVLAPGGNDVQLLLVRRATHEADPWSGQIALPGGRFEPHDASLLHTAIRETREETALDLSAATVLGELDELRPRTPVLPPVIVRPFVVTVPGVPALVPNHEVAELFWVELGVLFAPHNRVHTTVETRGLRMQVEAIDVGGRIIWGMTERILRGLERVL